MNAVTDGEVLAAPIATRESRPLYWLMRRELWENRSLYIAPLIAACVIFVGFLLQAMHLPDGVRVLATLDPERQRRAVSGIYGGMGAVIVVTMVIVTWFYALDALHSERRDRSILFWKSLPVSDTQTVLSKLFTAMVTAPLIAFVTIVCLQVLILLLSSVVVLIGGADLAPIWSGLQFFQITGALLYTLIVLSLWYAPVYAWLLFISAWAKKSTFLWSVLPIVAIVMFEGIAFHSKHFSGLIQYRLRDGLLSAFTPHSHNMPQEGADLSFGGDGVQATIGVSGNIFDRLDPAGFLSNPWLWVGLLVAAGLIAATIWMRRYREPI